MLTTAWLAPGRILDNRDNRALVAALDDPIAQLQRLGKKTVLIGPIAEPGWDVASTVSRQLAFGRPVTRATFLPASEFTRIFGPAVHHFQARGDIGFARPDHAQCRGVRCDYIRDGRSLFADSNHLAVAALPRFRSHFKAAMAASGIFQ